MLNFADTVEDYMTQFYAFKEYLIRIRLLSREAHFAFNLSNINSQNFEKRPSKIRLILSNETIWNGTLEMFSHQEIH